MNLDFLISPEENNGNTGVCCFVMGLGSQISLLSESIVK